MKTVWDAPSLEAATPAVQPAGAADESRRIGAILVDLKRLSLPDAQRVLAEQQRTGQPFGELAKRMNLIDDQDIQVALAHQFDYPYLSDAGGSPLLDSVVAAYKPFTPFVESLRDLRSQLLLRWFDGSAARRCLAVASHDRGDGRSFIAANLAVVFAQMGERTLLVDADLRHPTQHELFRIDNRGGLGALLTGRADDSTAMPIASIDHLSVLPCGPLPPNPQELLSRRRFGDCLAELAAGYDVVILDTSAACEAADAQMVARSAKAVLLAGRSGVSRMAGLQQLEADCQRAGATVIGSIFNAR